MPCFRFRFRFRLRCSLALALVLAEGLACRGAIEPEPAASPAGGPSPVAPPALPLDPPGPGMPPGGMPPGGMATVTGTPLRRLTPGEYARTVTRLFGTPGDLLNAVEFPEDPSTTRFGNGAELQSLSLLHLQAYARAADLVADKVLATPALRDKLLGCAPTGGAREGCLRRGLSALGLSAYRRPLEADELEVLARLALAEPEGPDPFAGFGMTIRAMLQSPHFLFLVERATPDGHLTGYELATRLSLFLLDRAPDSALLADAAKGGLDTTAGLRAVSERLLGTTEARETLRRFFDAWLSLKEVTTIDRTAKAFPQWSPELARAMREETLRFLDDAAFRPGASFMDIYVARHSFVDASLLRLYKLPGKGDTSFTRVDFADGPRAGLLTHASLLTRTGREQGTSAIERGAFIRKVLLCEDLPPPPNDVPALAAPRAGDSERMRLERHRSDPSCAGCHALLEPLGFGLENFDAIGAYREADALGTPIDGAGTLAGFTPPAFLGAVELGARLRAGPEASRCLVQNVLEHALGRSISGGDTAAVAAIDRAFAEGGYGLRPLLLAVATSDLFREVRR